MAGTEDTELAPSLSQATFLRLALNALNTKAARWAVLLTSFALFGYCAMQPHWIRLVGASAYALLFAIPCWWSKRG